MNAPQKRIKGSSSMSDLTQGSNILKQPLYGSSFMSSASRTPTYTGSRYHVDESQTNLAKRTGTPMGSDFLDMRQGASFGSNNGNNQWKTSTIFGGQGAGYSGFNGGSFFGGANKQQGQTSMMEEKKTSFFGNAGSSNPVAGVFGNAGTIFGNSTLNSNPNKNILGGSLGNPLSSTSTGLGSLSSGLLGKRFLIKETQQDRLHS